MQEYIVNGLLIVVALLAVILQIIGTRLSAGMTKKQKVMLWRILDAAVSHGFGTAVDGSEIGAPHPSHQSDPDLRIDDPVHI